MFKLNPYDSLEITSVWRMRWRKLICIEFIVTTTPCQLSPFPKTNIALLQSIALLSGLYLLFEKCDVQCFKLSHSKIYFKNPNQIRWQPSHPSWVLELVGPEITFTQSGSKIFLQRQKQRFDVWKCQIFCKLGYKFEMGVEQLKKMFLSFNMCTVQNSKKERKLAYYSL